VWCRHRGCDATGAVSVQSWMVRGLSNSRQVNDLLRLRPPVVSPGVALLVPTLIDFRFAGVVVDIGDLRDLRER